MSGRTLIEDIEVDCYNDTVDITVTTTSPDDNMEDEERLTIQRSSISTLIEELQRHQ